MPRKSTFNILPQGAGRSSRLLKDVGLLTSFSGYGTWSKNAPLVFLQYFNCYLISYMSCHLSSKTGGFKFLILLILDVDKQH